MIFTHRLFHWLPIRVRAGRKFRTVCRDRKGINAPVETLESRTLLSVSAGGYAHAFDDPATLVPTIIKSTLPTKLTAGFAAKGVVSLDIANVSAAAIKGKATLELFASSDGVVDSSSIELAKLARTLSVSTSTPKAITLPVKIGAAALATGAYTLLAEVMGPSSNIGLSASGPALTVTPFSVSLSVGFTKVTIPPTIIRGTMSHAVIVLRVTNTGDAPTLKPVGLTNAIFATAELQNFAIGSGGEGLTAGVFVRKQIAPGKSISVTVRVYKSIPAALTAGAQNLLALVSAGTATDAGVATYAKQITVEAPSVALLGTFTKNTIPSTVTAGAKAHAVTVLRITNSGNVANQVINGAPLTNKPGTVTVMLLATPSGDPAGTGTQIAVARKPLRILPGKSASLSIPVKAIPALPAGSYTITAEVTDPNGDITTAMSKVVNVTG